MTTYKRFAAICCALTLIGNAAISVAHAAAQDDTQRSQGAASEPDRRRWEVEFHGGGILSGHSTDGTASLLGPGAPFMTIAGLPSRRVSSWFFGDGAALLNQAHAVWTFATSRSGVVPLDPVLSSASVRRRSGVSFGVRASRHLNDRLAAEISVDYGSGSLALTKNTLKVRIDAAPETTSVGPNLPIGAFATAIATNPSIQFSGLNFGGREVPSSLSGPALNDFVTFEGRGIQRHLSLTTGLAWRF